jgi:hypothetical protein
MAQVSTSEALANTNLISNDSNDVTNNGWESFIKAPAYCCNTSGLTASLHYAILNQTEGGFNGIKM